MTSTFSTIVRTSILAAGFAAIASLASAQANLPLYEPFNYPAGNLSGNTIDGSTWAPTGSNASSPVQVSAGSLSYAGLPAPVGGKVTLLNGTSYEDPGLDIASQSAGTVYASFILKVVHPGNTTGDYIFNFSSAGTGSNDYRTRVFVRQGSGGANTYNVGLRHGSSDTIWWSSDYTTDTVTFVVAAYNFGPGSGDDSSSIWLNPSLGQSTAPTPDGTATASQDLAALGRIGLRQGSGDTSMIVEVDELRVATSWAQVTPSASAVQDWTLY